MQDLDTKWNSKYFLSPFYWACRNGLGDVALKLMENGAEVHCQDADSQTPFFWACRNNLSIVCEKLIEKGAHLRPQPTMRSITVDQMISSFHNPPGIELSTGQGSDPDSFNPVSLEILRVLTSAEDKTNALDFYKSGALFHQIPWEGAPKPKYGEKIERLIKECEKILEASY